MADADIAILQNLLLRFKTYTGLTTSNANSSGIGFSQFRLLRKTPFLTTGEAGAQESLKWRDLPFRHAADPLPRHGVLPRKPYRR